MMVYVFLLIASFCVIVTHQSEDYQIIALNDHNTLRQAHDSPDLALDDELNAIAVLCAEYYLKLGTIDHSCPYIENVDVGENLYSSQGLNRETALGATQIWYDEIGQYFEPGFSMETGHFTQVVWKDTRELGFGIADDGNGNVVACALYSPPGNYGDFIDYLENVTV